MWDTRMYVIAGLEVRVLSVLRDLFPDARRTCSFASSTAVPACFDVTCTVACSRARAAGVVAEVCQTVKTSASPLIWSKT